MEDAMSDDCIYYVYLHRGNSGNVYYVGMGKNNRAYTMAGRSHQWHIAVYKNGLNVEIIKKNISKEEAFNLEKETISHWRNLGADLVNQTEGGLGRLPKGQAFWPKGKKRPPEFCKTMSERRLGKKVPPHVAEKLRILALGRKHKPETRQKMRETRKNGTHNSKPIVVCGIKFQSMTAFARYVKVTPLCVKKWVDAGKTEKLEAALRGVKDGA
jgi:hypothetical protein